MAALIVLPVLAIATALILFGRYRYVRPTKGYPAWAVNNPEHPFLKRYEKLHLGYSRFHAVFSIFLGTFTIIAALIIYWAGNFGFLIALPLAVIATALLRPKLPESQPQPQPAPILVAPSEKRGLLSGKGKLAIVGIVVLGFAFVIGLEAMIRTSEPSKIAIERAISSREIKIRLGDPVKAGLFVSGSIETSGPSGHADLSIPLSGPKGKGTLYVVAQEKAGIWNFETLEAAVPGDATRIDLLTDTSNSPAPAQIDNPH